MDDTAAVAFEEHPLRVPPYTAIRFHRRNGQARPLYRVGKTEAGALNAMKAAHRLYGSSCFYCGKPMAVDAPAGLFTLDHVRPVALDGTDDLHNLVFSCAPCNKRKGGTPLPLFDAARAVDYADALDRHVVRSLGALAAPAASNGSDKSAAVAIKPAKAARA